MVAERARQAAGLMVVGMVLACLAGCEGSLERAGWVHLYDGSDLNGWKPRSPGAANAWEAAEAVSLDPADPAKFAITPGKGILVNGPTGRTTDIYSTQEFGDCEAHIEFVVPKGSNSGIYFMGRYEIQVFDSFEKQDETFSDCGGIYARWIHEQNIEGHAPRVNVSKAPGKWQWFDVVFRAPRFDAGGKKIENARFIEVKHNGTVIHENVSLEGPTRSGIEPEATVGPLLLQGDHGPVAYRNIRIKPLKTK